MLDQIVKIAVIGTEKKFFKEEDLEILKNWQLHEWDKKEKILLQATAIATKMQKAGFLTHQIEVILEESQGETLSVMDEKNNIQLKVLLEGIHSDLMPEFLELVAKNQKRIDFHLLPDLLMWGVPKKDFHALIGQIVGERGKWLSKLNPDWQYIADNPSEIDWQTASFADRQILLAQIRKQNPAQAIEILQSTWLEDDHLQRASFLKILTPHVSITDEPFLWKASQDGRKEVRSVAFDLLAQISEGEYTQKLIQYLQPYLVYKPKDKKNLIDFNLPEKFDTVWKDVGIAEKISITSGGQKANWLAQMLSKIPPVFWENLTQQKPDDFLKNLQKSDWEEFLVTCISQSAVLHKSQTWLVALFNLYAEVKEITFDMVGVAEAIESESYHGLLETYLKTGMEGLVYDKALYSLLNGSQVVLNDIMAEKVIDLFKALVVEKSKKSHYYLWQTKELLKSLSKRINPMLFEKFSMGWGETEEGYDKWMEAIHEFNRVLAFRKDMLEGLS
jgi:hypothetical protein